MKKLISTISILIIMGGCLYNMLRAAGVRPLKGIIAWQKTVNMHAIIQRGITKGK